MRLLSLPASLSLISYTYAQINWLFPPGAPTTELNHRGKQTFITRPDIEPAKWNIRYFDKSKVEPGYWFVSPYETNGWKEPGGSWIGPHIYDGDGELIWSGSHLLKNINVMDFKIINVDGKKMLSMLYAVEGTAYLLDNHYKIKDTVFTGQTGVVFNMHDFRTIEDGSKFLFLQRNITKASQEMSLRELGYDGECEVTFPAFEERDVKTKELLFKWDATGHIPLSDSTMNYTPVEDRCNSNWDFLHSNAIDKFADGNYMLSTRHSDTIYKISKDDGSIMWRLHGWNDRMSDFDINFNFSRQHHARIREQNDTHTIITLLDNAMGADDQLPTSKWTRALKIALREDIIPMTAELVASYDHPRHGHAFRRGSYQPLPGGNAFIGWSERALQSEHSPDGELLMQAALEADELGTYRAFKFPFTADPDYPPDIHSEASTSRHNTVTVVYVSWNGATEVSKWRLYKTDENGKALLELVTVTRTGFETRLEYSGYAKYVQVQALDGNDKPLYFGRSAVMETIATDRLPSQIVAQETAWLQENTVIGSSWTDVAIDNPISTFLAGVVCGVVVFFVVMWAANRGLFGKPKRGPMYQAVAARDAAEFEEARLDDLEPRQRYDVPADSDVLKLPEDDEDDDDEYQSSRDNARTPSSEMHSGG